MLTLIALVFSFHAGAQAEQTVIAKCHPTAIREWPANAEVEVTTDGQIIQMTVTTQFYGARLSEKYEVTEEPNEGTLTYSGMGVELVILENAEKHLAHLQSEKDGPQDLICKLP